MLTAPKLAWIDDAALAPIGYDDIVYRSWPNVEIVRAIDQWRPTPDAARFAEVAGAVDAVAIRRIARGLADQLRQAVGDLGAGQVQQAHRLAGLAGTLGFRRVSATWLVVSHGDGADLQPPAAKRRWQCSR